MRILLIVKPTKWGENVKKFIEKNFSNSLVIIGDWGDPLPESIYNWEGDYIISYLSPWILPKRILQKAKIAAINFHPAPPQYPGIGCYNFAIYNDAREYGVTCHHMIEKVDSGNIISVSYFPIASDETIQTLKEKSMKYQLELFYEIMDIIVKGERLPSSSEKWERIAYTRKDFQELCKLRLNMSEEELTRRLKATYFSGARDYPNIEIGGKTYLLVDSDEFQELRNQKL